MRPSRPIRYARDASVALFVNGLFDVRKNDLLEPEFIATESAVP